MLDVGATPGTDVYSPVDGTVVSISDFVIDGKAFGSRIDVRPSGAPSLIVSPQPPRAGSVARRRQPRARLLLQARLRRRRRGRRAAGAREARARPRQQRRHRRPSRRRVAALNILFVGDVVGRPGREALEDRLAPLRTELEAAVCIVNGENVADGVGITPKLAERLLAAGADAITLGNHTWRRQEIAPYLATSDRVVPPGEPRAGAPGRGLDDRPRGRRDARRRRQRDGLAVAAAREERCGRSWTSSSTRPAQTTPVVLVDVHAEATSEKVALARWLDGRVTAVIGTHTHVQTADARVQPGGTAAITDAGMTGPHDSVIGVKAELATHRMRTGMPVRFEVATGGVRIEGVLVECDASTGRATAISAGSGSLALERAPRLARASDERRRTRRRAARSRTSTSHDAVGSNCFTRSQ